MLKLRELHPGLRKDFDYLVIKKRRMEKLKSCGEGTLVMLGEVMKATSIVAANLHDMCVGH
jgi:hypothetical protein